MSRHSPVRVMLQSDLFKQDMGAGEGFVQIGTDILRAQFLREGVFGDGLGRLFPHAAQNKGGSVVLATLGEGPEGIEACGVYGGHMAHSENKDPGSFFQASEDILQHVGHPEEEGAVDFVDLAVFGDRMRCGGIGIQAIPRRGRPGFVQVVLHKPFSGALGYEGAGIPGPLDKEENGQKDSHLDRGGKVHHNGEHKGGHHDRQIALRRFAHRKEARQFAHVHRHHHENSRQGRQGDSLYEGAQKEREKQKNQGMDKGRDGARGAGLDVRGRPGYGSCGGNAAEKGAGHIAQALGVELRR